MDGKSDIFGVAGDWKFFKFVAFNKALFYEVK